MANTAVFMDRSKSCIGNIVPLPKDFVSRFVAITRRNKTLSLSADPDWPDVLIMRGTDQHGRKLVGTWSRNSLHASDGEILIMFRDTAQDGIHEREHVT